MILPNYFVSSQWFSVMFPYSWLSWSTKPEVWGAQWESNSLWMVWKSSLLTITPFEVPCPSLLSPSSLIIYLFYSFIWKLRNHCPISLQGVSSNLNLGYFFISSSCFLVIYVEWESAKWNEKQRKWIKRNTRKKLIKHLVILHSKVRLKQNTKKKDWIILKKCLVLNWEFYIIQKIADLCFIVI